MVDSSSSGSDRLPLWPSTAEAYWLTWSNAKALGGLIWLWLVVLLPVVAILYWAVWPFELASRAENSVTASAVLFLPTFFEMLAGASIAVAWHRRLLLGERTPGTAYFRLDRTVARYYGWAVLLFLMILGPILFLLALTYLLPAVDGSVGTDAVAPGTAPDGSGDESFDCFGACSAAAAAVIAGFCSFVVALIIFGRKSVSQRSSSTALGHDQSWSQATWPRMRRAVMWLLLVVSLAAALVLSPSFMLVVSVFFPVIVVLCYVPTRLSLILPAMALGHDQVSVRDVWQRTQGMFWRLFLGMALTAVPIICLEALFYDDIGEAETHVQFVRANAILSVFYLVLGMIGVSYLSVAYRQLFGLART